MDRKVRLYKHLDKPPHQRWLYKLSDMSFFKVWMLIWFICWACIALSVLLVKVVLSLFK